MNGDDTREQWLERCAVLFVGALESERGEALPAWRVSCGFPIGRRSAIGQCHADVVSKDGRYELFVSPVLDDPVMVAAVLAHELCHVAAGLRAGHGAGFTRYSHRTLSLEGKPTATVPGDAFRARFGPGIEALGAYPHGRMLYGTNGRRAPVPAPPGGPDDPDGDRPDDGPKRQTARMLKVECGACHEAGEPYIVRAARGTIERGLPWCPIHEAPMREAV